MPITTNKLKYIKATDNKYENLGDEIFDLHKEVLNNADKVSKAETTIDIIKSNIDIIKNTATDFSNKTSDEVKTARGVYSNLSDRLSSMEQYKVLNAIEKISTSRTYEYDCEGNITKESIRGGIEYDIIYVYDGNGNIVREEIYDLSNSKIGYKEYIYDNKDSLIKANSVNADILSVATNSLIEKELQMRVSVLENLDLVQSAKVINVEKAKLILEKIQEFDSRIENIECVLPDNITTIIDVPNILKRLDDIDNRLNREYVLYEFLVSTGTTHYSVPDIITRNTSIFLEGLLLKYGEDYEINNGKMTFLIPLIDDFKVTCKY